MCDERDFSVSAFSAHARDSGSSLGEFSICSSMLESKYTKTATLGSPVFATAAFWSRAYIIAALECPVLVTTNLGEYGIRRGGTFRNSGIQYRSSIAPVLNSS